MKLYYLIIYSLVFISCNAQVKKQNFSKKLNDFCPKADIIDREVKDDFTEVDILCDGVIYEIGLNANNEIIFIESEANLDQLPMDKIQKKLDKKYYGWVIDEYSYVELPDTSFYKVEIIKNGVEENVYFTLEGKYYKSEKISVDEGWDIEILSQSVKYENAAYNLLKPEKTYYMPESLIELSGIVLANDNNIFCVQDEAGIVYSYDKKLEEVSEIFRFTDEGDFEDIAVKNDIIYVLRSDGTLFYFNYKNFNGKVNQTVVPLNCTNIEGLFFDNKKNMLYAACKDELVNANIIYRSVYSFSPDNLHQPSEAFKIDLDEINKVLVNKYEGISEKKFEFNPSAIAIHPYTGEKYILSASNRLLVTFNDNGLSDVFPLPSQLYYKPEGIAFNDSGDLYISSEGIKKGYTSGLIHYFKMN